MARKTNKTQKLKSLVLRQIRSMEKRGYILPSDVVKEIKNANYSKLTSYHKDKYKRLYKESYTRDIETGDIISGYKGKLKRRWSRKKEPAPGIKGKGKTETGTTTQRSKEKDFYDRTGYTQDDRLSDSADVIVENVVDDFISQLSQEVPDYYYTFSGKKKHVNPFVKEEIEKTRNTLLSLVETEISEGRKEELAWRLQNNATEVSELIRKMFTDSNSTVIQVSRVRLAEIIVDRKLTVEESMDLEAEQTASDGYEEI